MGDTFDVPSYQHGMGSHLRDTHKSIHILKAHDIGLPGGANTKNTIKAGGSTAICKMSEWTEWMDGYPLDCYDYQSTCGAKDTNTNTKTDSETERSKPKVCYLFGKWMTQGL